LYWKPVVWYPRFRLGKIASTGSGHLFCKTVLQTVVRRHSIRIDLTCELLALVSKLVPCPLSTIFITTAF
jgi:hypothetical protein